MKNVRTVEMEELSKEQIEAARLRRSRDRLLYYHHSRYSIWCLHRSSVCQHQCWKHLCSKPESACREIASLNLESVELPENHPFAVKKRVSPPIPPL